MTLRRRVELIENSTDRMKRILELKLLPIGTHTILRQEARLHFKMSLRLLIAIHKKEAKE